MIRTAVMVVDDSSTFQVIVHAESIERAVALAEGRFRGSEVRVVFPVDSEAFFVKDPEIEAGLVEPG